MREYSYTLLCDGTSDRVLIPIIDWMLQKHFPESVWRSQEADLWTLRHKVSKTRERLNASAELFPADVIFFHRDAERMTMKDRQKEIDETIAACDPLPYKTHVPVVPVRMTEAWLLISESAIRDAASNPNGRDVLQLPKLSELEKLPDPKTTLRELLKTASGLSGRRLKKFRFGASRRALPDHIRNWDELLRLKSARDLYDRIEALKEQL